MKNTVVMAVAMAIFAAATVGCATAAEKKAPESLTTHYEAIRQALLHDTMKDVSTHAKAMQTMAMDLRKKAPANGAAAAANTAAARNTELLGTIESSSAALAKASDLKSARLAFGDLSAAVIGYQKAAGIADEIVVYCPMAKKSWLQPKGDIGNPYYGQSMARCGTIVTQ